MQWQTGEPKVSGLYTVRLGDGQVLKAKYFKCQMTGHREWADLQGQYIYDNIVEWSQDVTESG